MTVDSFGLLLWRLREGAIEVLLGHMGGPYWAGQQEHAWSVPKGLAEADDADPLAVAEREFTEEMGQPAPTSPEPDVDLGSVRAGSKRIRVFARQADFPAADARSNTFELEWPPRSGQMQSFPEIDRAEWVALGVAESFLTKGQGPFVERLRTALQG